MAVAMPGYAVCLHRPWRVRVSSGVGKPPQRQPGVGRAQASAVDLRTDKPHASPFCPQVRYERAEMAQCEPQILKLRCSA